MDALVAVRRRIAQAIAGQANAGRGRADVERMGEITLRPHQAEAVQRLLSAIDRHGGALLADAPGLGKTYVALAVARACGGAIVAAPAVLRAQWMRSAELAAQPIAWCSLETLSRRPVSSGAPLLIIDEAHHLRTKTARRYARAAALAVGKRVLLLTATPVHNRAEDRAALLALFLGSAAGAMDAAAIGQLVVRREADAALLPRREAMRWLAAPRTRGIAPLLRALPPPLPAADGRQAAALVRLTLAHAWSSSLAALDDTLRRALHRARATDDALAEGRWPTRRELCAWVDGDDAAQLAFAAIVAAPAGGATGAARAMLARHVRALEALRQRTAAARAPDAAARAALLRDILRTRRGTIVAFSRYAGTVDALWRALRLDAGVVAITSRGVRSAGGGLTRRAVLGALATGDATRDERAPLRLVLSTELLGEGLDLRAVSVIVHLDQPWTPARLDQREGRAMRLGSSHQTVAVYAVRPPPYAVRVLSLADRLSVKRGAMDASLAEGSAREALLQLVRPWLAPSGSGARIAAVAGAARGWVAAVRDGRGRDRVFAMRHGQVAEDDAHLLAALRCAADGRAATPPAIAVRAARRAIRACLRTDATAQLARASEGTDAARAAVVRRLDEALRAVPLHRRAALAPRLMAARGTLATMRGAGVERALASAAQCPSVEALLDTLDAMAASRAAGPRGPGPPRAPRLLALLLLGTDD